MTQPAGEAPVLRLPFQVRPQSGEGPRSFIIRLAQANCLPPAYLRKYLTQPPLHRGTPTWDRIAAVAGRDPAELRQILETVECTECGKPIRPLTSFGVTPRTCSKACRQRRYRNGIPASDWKKIPCHVCGQLMRLRLGQRRRMCSSHCRRLAFQFRQHGEPLPRPAMARKNFEPAETNEHNGLCPACEGPMIGATRRKGCSRRCSAKIAHWTRSPLPTATCRHCREPLLPRADGRPREWCSNDCRTQERHGQQTPAATATPPQEAEAELDHAASETPETAATSSGQTCRGCQRRYQPLSPNPWCSRQCLQRELLKRAELQECGACGVSMAHRKQGVDRIWCSNACRQRATRWNAELQARAQMINSGECWPKPAQPACQGCKRIYQPLRPNPWCSDNCLDQEVLRRSERQECRSCGTSMTHLRLASTRKWCSSTCRQRALRWRWELRDRAARVDIDPTSLAQTMQ